MSRLFFIAAAVFIMIVLRYREVVEHVLMIIGVAVSVGLPTWVITTRGPVAWAYLRGLLASYLASRPSVPASPDNRPAEDEDIEEDLARVLAETGEWVPGDQP